MNTSKQIYLIVKGHIYGVLKADNEKVFLTYHAMDGSQVNYDGHTKSAIDAIVDESRSFLAKFYSSYILWSC